MGLGRLRQGVGLCHPWCQQSDLGEGGEVPETSGLWRGDRVTHVDTSLHCGYYINPDAHEGPTVTDGSDDCVAQPRRVEHAVNAVRYQTAHRRRNIVAARYVPRGAHAQEQFLVLGPCHGDGPHTPRPGQFDGVTTHGAGGARDEENVPRTHRKM